MKPGTKLKSTVCDTEVMVIRGSGMVVECGGAPMAQESPAQKGSPQAGWDKGTQIGKRYVDVAGSIELLCVKPGKGSLSIAGVALLLKDAKPLPASD
jgi:hypothetical protein